MANDVAEAVSRNSKHRWRFFRSGGFDQVRLETGDDLISLDQLDQKLWVALSCPVKGLEFDVKTLELIDGDGDGRIRVPDIIGAVKWAGCLLKNPDALTKGLSELPLSIINDGLPEGAGLIKSAREILANLGKPEAEAISVEDADDTARIFSLARFNGDGLIPADSTDDPAVQQVITEIIDCLGPETDRSGKPAVSQAKADQFFADARAYSEWHRAAETDSAILPLGEATASASLALAAVRVKVDDYFTRCRLAKYDIRALGALNRQEAEYIAIAQKDLTPAVQEVSGFPLAQIGIDKPLPLQDGINPAWIAPMAVFVAEVVTPLLGERTALTEADWSVLASKFAAYAAWSAGKAGSSVEKLGLPRIREILESRAAEAVSELIARDKALEAEFANITSVARLVRYHRDLFRLLNNFVSFSDFYTRRSRAIFQAGTLYLDGRSCELCVRVEDVGKHATLAMLSRTYLAYCDCIRRGGTEKMTIAAAFTAGDSDYLMIGRNGVFYDRKGQDWDATIVRLIEHPISIRQAFWSPYKRIGRMINDQISKFATARDKAVTDKAGAGIADAGHKVEAGKPAAPPPPFDVGKFAGIFAAIGLAIGAIGTAIAAAVTGFMSLAWWKMPIAVVGLMLLVSGPSMIIAWLKLRQRTIGPILDANGWAINSRVRVNIPFGGSLTKIACLPEGAVRSLEDPFAEKKSPWPKVVVLLIVIAAVLFFLNGRGLLYKWTCGIVGTKPAVTTVVPGGGGAPATPAPAAAK
ncbi:MAG: hypothetical protein LLG97_17300 [Deltaproteobacteria bacterium]|nr:hypothetical protein [Deltaproteobacteria bacterium]